MTNPQPTSSATLGEAKAATIQVQDELAAYLPAENVAASRSITEATLLQCGEGEYKWPGGVHSQLQGEVDAAGILDRIRADFGAAGGWTVTDTDTGLELRHEDSRGFFVDFLDSPPEFQVLSFSACFPFDPGLGQKY